MDERNYHVRYETFGALTYLPKVVRLFLMASFPLLGLVFASASVFLIITADSIGVIWIFLISLSGSIGILLYGIFFISYGCAKYCFEKDGLVAKYPLQAARIIPWDNFQQVCVCYGGYTTRGERKASTYICCVKKGEKPNVYGRWKTDNVFRHRRVITITYTPQLYEGIKERCPYEVVDLRNTLNYRLDMS